MRPPEGIFRQYDIRGLVGSELTPEVAFAVGRAMGSRLADREAPTVAVGHDNRPSSPELAEGVTEGLNRSGVEVRAVGLVPTPVLYYADTVLETDGAVQVTGSHNPPEYNGLKLVQDGASLYGEAIEDLRQLILTEAYVTGSAPTVPVHLLDRYVEDVAARVEITGDVTLTLDCGNGTGSIVAVEALEAAGVEVDPLYCESDGTFPNHHPDPTVDENVRDLAARLEERGRGFGVGLDGDADRIGALTEDGRIVRGDHLLLLFALDLLERRPGAEVIFDVKCSMALPEMIEASGGRPVMWKTGHSLIKERMRRSGAPLAGEMSGHICFADDYYGFDDAIYAAARLAALVDRSGRRLAELADRIPDYPSTPELRLPCEDARKFEVVRAVARHYRGRRPVIDLDGARVEFDGGWGLVRASNTQPVVVVRFEAGSVGQLEAIRDEMAEVLAEQEVDVPPLEEVFEGLG